MWGPGDACPRSRQSPGTLSFDAAAAIACGHLGFWGAGPPPGVRRAKATRASPEDPRSLLRGTRYKRAARRCPQQQAPGPTGLCSCCSQAFASDDSCLIVQRLQERTVFSLGTANAQGGGCARPQLNAMHCLWVGKTWRHQRALLGPKETPNSQTPEAAQTSRNGVSFMWTTGGFLVVRDKPAFLRNL